MSTEPRNWNTWELNTLTVDGVRGWDAVAGVPVPVALTLGEALNTAGDATAEGLALACAVGAMFGPDAARACVKVYRAWAGSFFGSCGYVPAARGDKYQCIFYGSVTRAPYWNGIHEAPFTAMVDTVLRWAASPADMLADTAEAARF